MKIALDRVTPPSVMPRYAMVRPAFKPWRLAPMALAGAATVLLALSAVAATGSANPVVWSERATSTIQSVGHPEPPPSPTPSPEGQPNTTGSAPPAAAPARVNAHKASPKPSAKPAEPPEGTRPGPSDDHSDQGSHPASPRPSPSPDEH